MSKIKISFLIRESDIIWSYKGQSGKSFWEDVNSELKKRIAPLTLEQEIKGKFQHCFYVETDRDADYYKKLAQEVVAGLLDEQRSRKVIVSAIVIGDGAKKENSTSLLKIEEGDEILGEKQTSEPLASTPEVAEKAEEKSEEKAMTMAERAEKFKNLKEKLLDTVKGQRHAVEEVVQTVFESEMFSINNQKRKGPLATLLFAGPSGVGKTYLSETLASYIGIPYLRVDMSGYSQSDAVSELCGTNEMYKGSHEGIVTGFVRENPKCLILFDEVEKAHINAIHLFLQMLDGGYLLDTKTKQKVDFSKVTIIFTTNAGKDLYEDATECDLSSIPRKVILDALRKDINPQTGEPYFPECITTRMANGHVILFNHLEPFSLMEIVGKEITQQIDLFEKSSGIKVEYDLNELSSMVLYNGGGTADARTLRGLARNMIVSELQEIVMQIYAEGADKVNALKTITLNIDSRDCDDEAQNLFENKDKMYASVFTDKLLSVPDDICNTTFGYVSDIETFKKQMRGVTDYVLIDVLCGNVDGEKIPNDIEDFNSDGIHMFDYVREYYPEIPVYILDTSGGNIRSFETLLARGAKGVIIADSSDVATYENALKEVSRNAIINNTVYSLGRSGKFLDYNCAQYIIDESCVVVSFERLQLKKAPSAEDAELISKAGNTSIKFADIIGCKTAKKDLAEFCEILDNPRKALLSGKKIPKGILLYGPPGTGKTMLAKAMANECGATFFATTATSFFNKYVGQTEENIRNLFKKAKRYAPSIIFVDEVDSIGKMRTGGDSGRANEDALTTFLAEMDGFVVDEKRPVFVIAATNYEINGTSGRVLDPAFVRRFDSKVLISLPDEDDRYEFLVNFFKKHGINFGEAHNETLKIMAERTAGMSNADLESMNSQYLRLLGDKSPDRAQYLDVLDSYRYGDIREMSEDHLRQTAYHESGHALIYRLNGHTPTYLTVVSRGDFGGYMARSSDEFKGTVTFDNFMNSVCCCLGGRAAEIEVYGEKIGMNTGAGSDIEHAREQVRASIQDYAMGEKIYSEFNHEEAEKLLQAQFARAKDLLRQYRGVLDKLTDLLAEKKSLDEKALDDFFKAEGI
ncbi:MAG: AAA family ATPase [Ruminococcaceae bacterium]|nr:AAA family ATPase [Oscillospiraceae bacterium]